jgi:hypothetical protein
MEIIFQKVINNLKIKSLSPTQIGEYSSTTECTQYLTNKMSGSVFPVCGK